MSAEATQAALRAQDAESATALLAVDPSGLGGVAVRSGAGPVRDAWFAYLCALLAPDVTLRRLPLNITDDRLLGGLDLGATLIAGRRIAEQGLLALADGGVVIAPMAERLGAATSWHIGAALETGVVAAERDGLTLRAPARFALVAYDEGAGSDERLADGLLDRLAFHLNLEAATAKAFTELETTRAEIAAARARLGGVTISDDAIEALCATALALGIGSARAVLQAVRAARASASLAGRAAVDDDDLTLAGRLVFGPRARSLPPANEPENAEDEDSGGEPEAENEPTPPDASEEPDKDQDPQPEKDLQELLLDSVVAALPDDLLAKLDKAAAGARQGAAGRTGARKQAARRGRPMGHRQGRPSSGTRLDLVATLTQAAPWQQLRKAERAASSSQAAPLIEIRRDDFRIKRFAQRLSQTTIFAVDASGSAAFQRLGEAKGAVELLLADCYIRRDRVALLAFRGTGAEVLLAPTRSTARARRALAELPGGGGTPLAAGLDLARTLADQVRRQDELPLLIVMTDGGANIGSDGRPGRPRALADAISAAHRLKGDGLRCLLIDTATRPQPQARQVADALGALYVPLPNADAASISRAAKAFDTRGPRHDGRSNVK